MWSFPEGGSRLPEPGFQEEALVIIGLIFNHIDGIKIHLMIVFMDVAVDLRVMVEHSNRPFVFRNPGFHCSLRLAVVHKITAGAIDFVHYARFWAIKIILSLWARKQTVDGFKWFVGDFNLLLS